MAKISYQEQLEKHVAPYFLKEHHTKNKLSSPRITKVIINCGIGKLVTHTSEKQDELVKQISEYLSMITGQKPKLAAARVSVAAFKLREGMPVGLVTTLRGKRMEEFIDRFINITLPRSRDFWGISKKHFDKRGNLSYGMKEVQSFPELAGEMIKIPFGLELTFATNTKTKEEGIKLFELLGFPLMKEETKR